ncbi:amidohydrolase family protein [Flagellimonas sp.]|uniref:amidohydrolase family protein n=1 Tax=Flagellimonas sp. TaxID=2058762 RepID=UPI003B5029EC
MKTTIIYIFSFIMINSLHAQIKGKPIIDMHQHARFKVWLDENGSHYPRMCFPVPCEPEPAKARNGEDILKIALEEMKKYNVVKAVVSDENLENVYKWKASAPEKFIAGGAFFSIQAADSVKFREELKKGNIGVMGEIGVQYDGMAPNNKELGPYFSLAEEFDIPVLIHCGGIGGGDHRFNLSAGNPLLVQEVLIRHPNLRIYIENAAWPFLEEITSLMYRYPNVYADFSTIVWLAPEKTVYTYLKGLIDNGLGKRIMYGSDQMEWPESIGIGIERIQKADFLTEEQKRDFFYNNAARFLKLTDEEIKMHHKQ